MLVVSAAPWQVTWDPSALPEGTYAIIATATDLAGNTSAPSTVTVVFGTTGGGGGATGQHGGCGTGGGGGLLIVLALPFVRRRRATRR